MLCLWHKYRLNKIEITRSILLFLAETNECVWSNSLFYFVFKFRIVLRNNYSPTFPKNVDACIRLFKFYDKTLHINTSGNTNVYISLYFLFSDFYITEDSGINMPYICVRNLPV